MNKEKKTLDPRTKFIITLLSFIFISIEIKFIILCAAMILILLFIICLKKIREFTKWLRIILPMVIFFGIITFITDSVQSSLVSTLRLFDLFSIFFIFFSTTSIENIADIFTKLKFPNYFTFILVTGYNFVPILIKRAKNIYDAQRSRGINLENKFHFFKNFHAFFIPFLIQSFKLADELAESLETRGFGLEKRTTIKKYKFTIFDTLILIISSLLLIIYIFLSFFHQIF